MRACTFGYVIRSSEYAGRQATRVRGHVCARHRSCCLLLAHLIFALGECGLHLTQCFGPVPCMISNAFAVCLLLFDSGTHASERPAVCVVRVAVPAMSLDAVGWVMVGREAPEL